MSEILLLPLPFSTPAPNSVAFSACFLFFLFVAYSEAVLTASPTKGILRLAPATSAAAEPYLFIKSAPAVAEFE
jgi:hypothetical protein